MEKKIEKTEIKEKTLKVKRKSFENNGKECWQYYLEENILGKKMEINLAVKDKDLGMYEILDLIFSGKQEADLYHKRDSMVNPDTKEVTEFDVYTIKRLIGSTSLEAVVIPYRKSDKQLLKFVFDTLKNDDLKSSN